MPFPPCRTILEVSTPVSMIRLLAVSFLLASASAAQPTAARSAADAPPHDRAPPSPAVALLTSAGATAGLAGLGALAAGGDGELAAYLVVAGLVVGPSAGSVVLGEYRRGATGVLLRAGGTGMAAYGLRRALSDDGVGATDVVLVVAGSAAALAGLAYDLRTQHQSGRPMARVQVRGAGLGLAVAL